MIQFRPCLKKLQSAGRLPGDRSQIVVPMHRASQSIDLYAGRRPLIFLGSRNVALRLDPNNVAAVALHGSDLCLERTLWHANIGWPSADLCARDSAAA